MDRYIGIDAHDKSCTAVVLDRQGRELIKAVLETNGERLRAFVEQVPQPRHVAFEEGNLSEWLYELLEPVAQRVVVFVPGKHPGQKDDARDAREAAEKLRLNAFERTVFKPTRELAELRCAVRGYQAVCRDLVRAKLRMSALFRSRAVFEGEAIYDKKLREKLLERLPAPERGLAKILGDEVDALEELFAQQQKVLRRAARTPEVRRLETIPGIGPVRAATIVAVVGTPHRFRTTRQFWSYIGLGVVERSSSDWAPGETGNWQRRAKKRQTRGLNRNRNASLKEVFKGAAVTLVGTGAEDPHAEAFRSRVLKGQDGNLSMLTLARQLAATALAMWKNKEDYDPTRYHLPQIST